MAPGSELTRISKTNVAFSELLTSQRIENDNVVWSRENKHVTSNLLRQRGYDQLFNTNYVKGTDNEILMLLNGWVPVCDCGQDVYEYVLRS